MSYCGSNITRMLLKCMNTNEADVIKCFQLCTHDVVLMHFMDYSAWYFDSDTLHHVRMHNGVLLLHYSLYYDNYMV